MRFTLIYILTTFTCFAQPGIEWQKTIGGNNLDTVKKIINLEDGYLISGQSLSIISGDKTVGGFGGSGHHCWVIKLGVNGEIIWQKAYGGGSAETNFDVVQTNDNGFLFSFTSSSNISGNKTENSRGFADYWLVKTDELGNIVWQKTIGGNNADENLKAIPCADGGYFLGGSSSSSISGEKTEDLRGFDIINADYWVLKLDENRNIEWQRTIGGTNNDRFVVVRQTEDEGFLIAGHSRSDIGFEKTENSRGDSSFDYWILKLNPQGDIEWQKTIGSNSNDLLYDMLITPENDILIGGVSGEGISGDKTVESNGGSDFWILKLNSFGEILWQKSIGGNDQETIYMLSKTSDGNYLLGGSSNSSISGDKTSNSRGLSDYWAVLIDSDGTILGQKTIGGNDNEAGKNVIETPDGGYFIAGNTFSGISGEKTEASRGQSDYWVLKLEPNSLAFANPILSGLQVYPNPTAEMVNINFTTNFSGTITQTDLLGKEIKILSVSDVNEVSFKIEGEESIYFITLITNSGEKESIKIIKRK
jgi:hypothetical protein